MKSRAADIQLETVEEQARKWFALMQSDRRTDTDVVNYNTWLNADLAHRRAYREIENMWGIVDDFADKPEIQTLRKQALSEALSTSEAQSSMGVRRWLSTAVAASVLVVVFLTLDVVQLSLVQSLFADGVYQTRVGEQTTVTLADGSTLILDTQTRLRTDFTNQRRLIELEQGQARFSVAHDPARPFVVQAGNGAITALGTVFLVKKTSREIRVTLLEGKVVVAPTRSEASDLEPLPETPHNLAGIPLPQTEPAQESAFPTLLLEAGQQVAYTDTVILSAAAVNLEQATAWQQGRLIFDDNPLVEVLDDLNRYSKSKILIGDDRLTAIRITGVFKTGDNARIVESLKAYFSMRVSSDKHGNLVLLPAG